MTMITKLPVTVVGIPPSGGLDPVAGATLAAATLVCGAPRHLARVPSHGEKRLELDDVGLLVERLRDRPHTELAVVVGGGDPLLFGIGATLVRELGRDQVAVLPAVSAVQVAFARAGVAWSEARILSAHGRELAPVVPAALGSRVSAVLCGPASPPQTVARALLDGGMEDSRAVVAERLGEAEERVFDATLSAVAERSFDHLAVLVVEREEAPATPLAGFGRAESAFSSAGGMITRAEVRAVALSLLGPAGASVIWDVGAGSGSVGIEAAGLAPGARLIAVERDAAQVGHLRSNVEALVPGGADVVRGEAPEALAGLADPDRVIVGGHGGRLGEILGVVRGRLAPAGRVVCHFATLDGVLLARAALGDWSPRLVQLAVSRGVPAGRSLRLRAEDPVFLLVAERPA